MTATRMYIFTTYLRPYIRHIRSIDVTIYPYVSLPFIHSARQADPHGANQRPSRFRRSVCRVIIITSCSLFVIRRYSGFQPGWLTLSDNLLPSYRYRFRLTMISLSLTLEREFDDYVITIRRLNQCSLYLAPKLEVITYHLIRYRS